MSLYESSKHHVNVYEYYAIISSAGRRGVGEDATTAAKVAVSVVVDVVDDGAASTSDRKS